VEVIVKRIFILFSLFLSVSSSTSFVLAAPYSQQSSNFQEEASFYTQKPSNQNKSDSLFPFYVKTGLAIGVLSVGCLYYYGLYKGFQFAVEKVPTLFSSLTNFVKTNSTKFINSDSIKKG